ncbi:MAG: hypothetical protein JO346_00040, partial [Alphaproteobacteria bacterium]|nr:hypothetical protein [Alphaproteobacteria bacterium]
GGTVYGLTPDGNYIIARVSGIQHPAADMTNFSYYRAMQQLSGEVGGDITLSLAKAEKDAEHSTVNQALVNQAIGNSGSGS